MHHDAAAKYVINHASKSILSIHKKKTITSQWRSHTIHLITSKP